MKSLEGKTVAKVQCDLWRATQESEAEIELGDHGATSAPKKRKAGALAEDSDVENGRSREPSAKAGAQSSTASTRRGAPAVLGPQKTHRPRWPLESPAGPDPGRRGRHAASEGRIIRGFSPSSSAER